MFQKKWILVILSLTFSLVSYAQTNRPNHPTITYLTIDLNTGHPTIYWAKEAFDPLCEPTTGYIIYKKSTTGNCVGNNCAIDTVPATTSSYTDYNSNGNLSRLTYNVATLGTTKTSQLWIAHSNMFIVSNYDSCNHKLDLRWDTTNYEGWGNRIKKYDVYVGNDKNWAAFPLYTSLPGTTPTVSITNAVENQNYYVYVEATKDTTAIGGIPYVSRSNLFYTKTTMSIHPVYMSIDSIIAEDKKVNLYFKIDPKTGIRDFEIVRWENSDSIKSIFSKKILYKFPYPTTTFYADTIDSWAARTRPFYYKIDALNGCPKIVKITNHSNSITPKVHAEGMTNRLNWDQLFIDSVRANKGNNAKYRIIRYAYTTVDLPPTYLYPDEGKLEYVDDLHVFEGQGYSIKFCYQIEGMEHTNQDSMVMLSRSRLQCSEIVPGVVMPDAIIPTDTYVNNGNARNILVPIITFKANYTLSVYNRWGNLIFNGENEGWNGHLSGGQLAKEGAYVYRLVVHTAGNRDVIKTGNVSVIYH